MHFRILKMIATNGFLTVPECTKFDFGPGSAPDPTPRPLASLRGLLQRGEEGKGGKGRGKEGREGKR